LYYYQCKTKKYFSSKCHPHLSSDCLLPWPNYILALHFNSLKEHQLPKPLRAFANFLHSFFLELEQDNELLTNALYQLSVMSQLALFSFFDLHKSHGCHSIHVTIWQILACPPTDIRSMTNVPPWSQRLSLNGLLVAGAEIHTLENHIPVCFLFWIAILGRITISISKLCTNKVYSISNWC